MSDHELPTASRRQFLSLLTAGAGALTLLAACGAGGSAATSGSTSAETKSIGGVTPSAVTTASSRAAASTSAAASTASQTATSSAASNAVTTTTAPAASTGSSLATGKADLTVIYWGGQQDKETNSKIIDQYTSAHPQVHVTATLVTGSFDDKLQAMVAGGTPPDVFEMAEAFVGYAAKGVTLDLSQFIKQTNFDLGDFYPNILRAYTYQGKVEGIPPRGGPMVLFYNKDLFNKVGATMPTAGWTWDDFMTATTKLSVGVGDTKTYGIGSGNWWPWWMSAVYQNGGSVLNHDKTQATLDTDAAIGGLQWFSDWFNKYKIAPNATESKTLPKGGGDQWIVQGKTGMDETGFWAVSSNDKAAGFNWAAAPLPKGKVAATVLFSNAWCLTSEGKQQAAAFDLVTALTSKPSQEIIAKTRQDMPTRKSVATSAVFTGDEPADHTQAFITSEDMIIDMPITPQWNQMLSGKVTGNIINDLIAGKTDASTAGKQMTTNINTALKG